MELHSPADSRDNQRVTQPAIALSLTPQPLTHFPSIGVGFRGKIDRLLHDFLSLVDGAPIEVNLIFLVPPDFVDTSHP